MNTKLQASRLAVSSPHRACLVTQDRKLARAVTRTLVPRKIQVDQFGQLCDAPEDLSVYSFVLIDGDLADPSKIEAELERASTDQSRVIVFSQTRERAHLGNLLGKGNLTNFIAKNGGIREEELLVTMHKLLTREFFGMAQYLTHGTIPVERTLHSSSERLEALADLVTFLKECLVSGRFVELARSAADELLMNALFRAPATASINLDTAEAEGSHPVTLQYACDGRHAAISVSDAYGSLTEERLFRFLGRCFSNEDYRIPNDTTGGGLGLYVAFRSADQFVINIAKGSRTEVICLIDIRGHLRDFESRSKSFHLFVTGGE